MVIIGVLIVLTMSVVVALRWSSPEGADPTLESLVLERSGWSVLVKRPAVPEHEYSLLKSEEAGIFVLDASRASLRNGEWIVVTNGATKVAVELIPTLGGDPRAEIAVAAGDELFIMRSGKPLPEGKPVAPDIAPSPVTEVN
jgi:hypothetical protein